MEKLASEMNSEGDILVRSEEFRSQEANRKRCVEKLDQIIARALFVPRPRRKTRPTRSSVRKRVDSKKHEAQKKANRKPVKLERA
jgi:ribosome-associated protein